MTLLSSHLFLSIALALPIDSNMKYFHYDDFLGNHAT